MCHILDCAQHPSPLTTTDSLGQLSAGENQATGGSPTPWSAFPGGQGVRKSRSRPRREQIIVRHRTDLHLRRLSHTRCCVRGRSTGTAKQICQQVSVLSASLPAFLYGRAGVFEKEATPRCCWLLPPFW